MAVTLLCSHCIGERKEKRVAVFMLLLCAIIIGQKKNKDKNKNKE
jgi:hypothetical protein